MEGEGLLWVCYKCVLLVVPTAFLGRSKWFLLMTFDIVCLTELHLLSLAGHDRFLDEGLEKQKGKGRYKQKKARKRENEEQLYLS